VMYQGTQHASVEASAVALVACVVVVVVVVVSVMELWYFVEALFVAGKAIESLTAAAAYQESTFAALGLEVVVQE
jgi:succinate dehydrogenase hydrophobic anchor subunit